MPTVEIANLADVVRVHGAERSDAVALHVGDDSITFAQLDERSNRAAQAFKAAGVGFGDRVAFIEKNGAEYFDVSFGLAKLGAVCVAVNWRLAPPEMRQIIEDSHAQVVVVGSEFFGHIEVIEDKLTRVHTVVAVGEHDRWPGFTDWIAVHAAEDPGVITGPGDVSFQLYTSGTTGLPKGVLLSNDNLFGGLVKTVDQWRLTEDSVNLAAMPMFHIAGAGWAMVGLTVGCTNVVMRDVDPAEILKVIPRRGITNAFLAPAVIQFLLTTPGVDETDFSTLRAIAYGASPISDEVLVHAIERFACEFIQLYGMTETTGAITQLDAVDHEPRNRPELLRSCGQPYPGVDVRITDANGQNAPTGTVGELWTRSRQNMLGYWNQPDATMATITPDGWLRTGDAGYVDDEGYIFLFDRVKDMIVTGGENVYPAEVENVLIEHPGIGDVAVFGVPDPKWGEAVKAIVVPAGTEPTESDVIAFARERLAGYKLPKSVDFAASLPRNPSGKLLKRDLREPYWKGVERRVR
jgi:long-chain acyl-CoA synthetase